VTAINHALTGAAIGLVVGEPLIALPAALASHYICDALPHWTPDTPPDKRLRSSAFRNYLIAEALLCFALVVVLALTRPEHWALAAVCAFVAASPDLLWIPRYIKTLSGKQWKPSAYSKFALNIQWFTKPVGAVVEIVWFIAAIVIILPFIY
jgi:hypothetical protein